MSSKAAQLKKYPFAFKQCRSRTWGHQWDDIVRPTEEHYWSVKPDAMMRCMRCGNEKFLWFDAAGNIVARQDWYVDGYKLAGLYRGDRLTNGELNASIIKDQRGTGTGRAKLTKRPKRHLKAV